MKGRVSAPLLALLIVQLPACTEPHQHVGGGGGSGGFSSTGGTGGEAGSGGRGEPGCGDGHLDAGEECDDGNMKQGDGCWNCRRDGTCADPYDWVSVATVDQAGQRTFVGSIAPLPSLLSSVCGGGPAASDSTGPELVFRYVPEASGELVYEIQADLPAMAYVRTTCGDDRSELGCWINKEEGNVAVEQGTPIYLIVDAGSPGALQFGLATLLVPYRQAGQTCDYNGGPDTCAQGLTCRDRTTPNICTPDSPPNLVDLEAYVRGADLYLLASVSDPNRDATGLIVSLLDTSYAPVLADLNFDQRADAEERTTFTHLDDVINDPARGYLKLEGLAGAHPEIARVRARAVDSALETSDPLTAEVVPQPVVDLGGACDPNGAENHCTGGVCVPADPGGTCEATESTRQQACDGAQILPLDGTQVTVVPVADGDLWVPPASCSRDDPLWGEAVLRVDIPSGLAAVTFYGLGTPFYLVDSCGVSPNVLACGFGLEGGLEYDNPGPATYYLVVEGYPLDEVLIGATTKSK